MPRASWKGFIRLSLVSTVEGYSASASGETQIALNQLHRDCGSRIRYQKVCPNHGEVAHSDIMMGYQFEKDRYVAIDADELAKLRSERDYSLNIDRFVKPDSIDPIYFAGKSYYLLPHGKAGEKPYALLNQAMSEVNVYGLAQVVISNREQLVVIRSLGKLLAVSVLQYAANVRQPREFEQHLQPVELTKEEARLAKMLVLHTQMAEPELEQFHDLYNERLKELVEAKIAGYEIIAPEERASLPTINYLDPIRASLQRRAKSAPKATIEKKKKSDGEANDGQAAEDRVRSSGGSPRRKELTPAPAVNQTPEAFCRTKSEL